MTDAVAAPRVAASAFLRAVMPGAIVGALALSYAVDHRSVLAPVTAAAAAVLAIAGVGRLRRRGFAEPMGRWAWLPVAAPAVLTRLAEGPTHAAASRSLYGIALGAATATVLGVDLPALAARLGLAVAAGLRRVVGTVLGGVLILTLGATRWWRPGDPLGTGRGPRGGPATSWHPVATRPPRTGRLYRFERDRRSPGRRMLRLAPTLVVVAAAIVVVRDRRATESPAIGPSEARPGSDTVDRPASTAEPVDGPLQAGLPYTPFAHEDEPFARELFVEQTTIATRPDDELYQVLADQDHPYDHIRDLARRSWAPPGDPDLEVWFFGGSSMYGIGQRDDHTIPSVVARLAAADGIRLEVVNFGVAGYVRWQEAGLFHRLLRDRPRPDLVVFYDGINDATLYCRQRAEGIDPATRGLIMGQPGGPPPPSPAADCLTDPVASGRELAGILADQLGATDAIPVVLVFQPTIQTKRHDPVDAPVVARTGADPVDRAAKGRLQRTLAAETAGALDLTGALDGQHRPTLFDWAHTNERGAAVVARAMYRGLEAQLRQLAGRR